MNDHICSGRCRREGCPNCPHGKGDEEHCDVCDKVTKAKESDEKPCCEECSAYADVYHDCRTCPCHQSEKPLIDHYAPTLKALNESDEKPIGTAPPIICGNPTSYGQLSAPCTLPQGHPTGPHESKPQDWEDGLKEALAAPNDAKHWYDYQRRVFDEIRSLLDSRYQEGVKSERARIIDDLVVELRSYHEKFPDADYHDIMGFLIGVKVRPNPPSRQ